MEANELRIGNIVLYNDECYYVENIKGEAGKAGIYKLKIPENSIQFLKTVYCDLLKPIPLTKDILDKIDILITEELKPKEYRFKAKYWESISKVKIYINDDGILNSITLSGLMIDIKYVYELQNLYFALSGKELNIKL